MKINYLLGFGLLASLVFTSCKKDSDSTPANDPTNEILTDFGSKIAIPIYTELDAQAEVMVTKVTELKNTPTQANLVAAQNQWLATRSVWEQSEGMLFGPVDDDGLDPAIDSWPIDLDGVNAVLNSTDALTADYINALADDKKGFHPIEFLLFGDEKSRKAEELTSRQLEFLVALATNLATKTEAMHVGWAASGGNFSAKLSTAGKGSDKYAKRRDGVLAVANALVGIVDEVGGGKIETPFAAKAPEKEESPFAINSWKDFTDNIRGAKNIYMGTVKGNTAGSLHNLIAKYNSALDYQIQQKFDAAITNLSAYTTPFGKDIIDQPTKVQATQTVLKSLQTHMQDEMIPLIELQVKD